MGTSEYGYRVMTDEQGGQRLVLGSGMPGGPFVRQTSEMQPKGHWVAPDHSLHVLSAGVISALVLRLQGWRYVRYPREVCEPKVLDW